MAPDPSPCGVPLVAGSFLSVIGTAGYYAAYVVIILRTVSRRISIGRMTFLSGAILQISANIQQIFSTVSSIADQALFLTDLLAFFEMEPTIRSKPQALPAQRCPAEDHDDRTDDFPTFSPEDDCFRPGGRVPDYGLS